jgi:hypothetical protein
MPRRIYTYSADMGWDLWNLVITLGALVFAIGLFVSIGNVFASLRRGDRAGADPWKADGLEWSIPSPPPVYAFMHLPLVEGRHPLWDSHNEYHDPRDERILDRGRLTFSTTVLDAHPTGIARMPGDTPLPLILAVALTALFSAFLLKALWIALVIAVACLIAVAVWLWPAPSTPVAAS